MTHPHQAQQMQQELEKVKRQEAEFEALQDLLHRMRAHPIPGDYRTQNGYHVRISNDEGEGVRLHQVPAEKQQLEPGALWLPHPPVLAPTETPVGVDALWSGIPGHLWGVAPQQVGFNDLGEAPDGKGSWCRYYQLKQMTVKWVDGCSDPEYKAVSSPVLDLTRPYLRVHASGGFEEVLPVRMPVQWTMAAPTQSIPGFDPLPATTQQVAGAPVDAGMDSGPDFIPIPGSGYVGQEHDALNPSGMPLEA